MTTLNTEADLRTVYKRPKPGVMEKDIGRLDEHLAGFIRLSPFLCLGTTSANGPGDVSPRGGEPGFVHVLDDRTLAMPDRPGNNRLDTLSNLMANPGVGLLFFVPGFDDTVRVNGYARVTTDPELIERFTIDGKAPRSVVLIEVAEAYIHCPKAIKRAGLWDPANHVDRKSFPTQGQMVRDQLKLEMEVAVIDAVFAKDAKDNLY